MRPRRRRAGQWTGWHAYRHGLPQPGWPRPHPGLADPADHAMRFAGRHQDGTLSVVCWCQRKVLRLPAYMIREGRTGSCGRPDCRPPAPIATPIPA